jgi:phosphoribosylglycinamide formyltransferase-1
MGKKLGVGVLASGGGTDLQSIIDASDKKMIDASVIVVISDNKHAFALERAKKHHIETEYLDLKDLDRKIYDKQLNELFESYNPDLIVGAGYMRMLSSFFVEKWYGKLINIHPALLPSFKGIDGQIQAFKYGVKLAGCTTHFIDDKMDHGPIILQAAIKVLFEDTEESLKQRILEVEHQILPRTVQLFAQGRLHIQGRRVIIDPGDSWLDIYPVIPNVLYSEGY